MEIKPETLIEAALFSAGRPLSVQELSEGLKLSKNGIQKILDNLINTYSTNDSAIEIIRSGNNYSMQVKPQLAQHVKFFAQMEIPEKVLKTAALIAYHQPIKQSDLQEMFGSKVYDHVKVLNEFGLIRKRQEGRTIVLTTTQQFSEYFGIDTTDREKIKEWLAMKIKKFDKKAKKNKVKD